MTTPHHESFATRLYRGDISYDFIGRRKVWYAASGALVLISLVSMFVRGLHPSIDFKGGDVFQLPRNGHSIGDVRAALSGVGVTPEVVQTTGAGADTRFLVETKSLPQSANNPAGDVVGKVQNALASKIGIKPDDVNVQSVGSTWGSQITKKAIYGLVIFLIAVIIYLSFRFEWKMALAAIIALIYFGYGRTHHLLGLATFVVLGAMLVWTSPNRWGVGIALHYLSRAFWPDPSDPIPEA